MLRFTSKKVKETRFLAAIGMTTWRILNHCPEVRQTRTAAWFFTVFAQVDICLLMRFNPSEHPVLTMRPGRLTGLSAWEQHIPFAFLLIELARPRVLVELGAHAGDSYCAFCQAVTRLETDTRCFAIDTWQGDVHSGLYSGDILEDLRWHHDDRYSAFSQLVQATFDDAAARFAGGSIDILHIDGLHTYEAVKHDFENWRPKVSERGLVLFHDTQEKGRDFGVYRLWAEAARDLPSFEFHHGHGLGVLALGDKPPQAVVEFLEDANAHAEDFRRFFHQLGAGVALRRAAAPPAVGPFRA
jgi:O-antigen biosynthesis protein